MITFNLNCYTSKIRILNGDWYILEKALNDAQLQGKKLLFVTGEDHGILYSLFFHIIILELAKTKRIEHLIAEVTEEHMQQILYHPKPDKKLNVESSIPHAAHLLKMKVMAMNTHYKEFNEETVFLRESYMEKTVLSCKNHAIVFTGYAHLKYFNNIQFKEKYHVVLMDIQGISDERRKKILSLNIPQWQRARLEFTHTSAEVIRLQVKGNMELFSREEILDWRNMHKNRENSQPISERLADCPFGAPKAISSGFSSMLTQASAYLPSFFGQPKEVQMTDERDNKRKRPEDETEKNKKPGKIRRIGSSSSHSQGE